MGRAAIRSSLRRPGRLAALRRLAWRLDHSVVEPRLDDVRARTLILVRALDPDYADPAAELAWVGDRLRARVLLVADAAHYAQAQRPDLVVPEGRGRLAVRAGLTRHPCPGSGVGAANRSRTGVSS